MTGLLLVGARVAAADAVHPEGWLATDGARISGLGPGSPSPRLAEGREVVDASGGLLLPGFVDVHVHGAAGHDTMDADPDGLAAMSAFFATRGVTSFLATTWAAGPRETLAAVRAVAAFAGAAEPPGARALGVHLEGPFLSPARCGAQDARHLRPVDREEARRLLDPGAVRVVTVAPEVDGAGWLVEECTRRGIAASLGHSDATYEQAARAAALGARMTTHTFNAMRPLHHREPGIAGAALALPALVCEVIADGVHLHPAVVRAVLAAKGVAGTVLSTDAVRVTGLGEGRHDLGGRGVEVAAGAVRLAGGTLAGSILTMDAALRNAAEMTGQPPERLWPTTSRTPAAIAGAGGRKGVLAPGMDADLVLLDRDGDVRLTAVEGRVVHRRGGGPAGGAPRPESRA